MTVWIHLLNAVSEAWAAALWRGCWQGGIAILAIYAAIRLLPRLTAPVQNTLWRLVHLKLILGLLWAAPVLLPLLPAPSQAPRVLQVFDESYPSTMSPGEGADPAAEVAAAQPLPEVEALAVAASQAAVVPSGHSVLLMLWLIGLGVYVRQAVKGIQTAERVRRGCAPVSHPQALELCHELCDTMGIRRTPQLLASPREGTPILMGLLRPAIVLPPQVLQRCNPEALKLILAHELAHLRRGDLFWSWLLLILRGIFFFHPLVWLADREWRETQELACDHLALQTTRATPWEYGAVLLHVAEICRPYPVRAFLSLGIAESFRTLQRRLVIMRQARSASRRWVAAGAFLLALSATGLVPWQLVPRPVAAAPAAASRRPPLFDFERDTQGWFSRIPNAPVTVSHARENVRVGRGALQWSYDPNNGAAMLACFQPELPDQARTLDFWLRSSTAAVYQLYLVEGDGSVYHMHLRTPGSDWQHYQIPLTDLVQGEREDANGRLDLDHVVEITLQDLSLYHPEAGRLAPRKVWLDALTFTNDEVPPRRSLTVEDGHRKLLVDDFNAPVITWAANTRAKITVAQSEGLGVLRARYQQGPFSPSNFRITNHWDARYNAATGIEVVARASRPVELTVTLREFDGTFTGPEYTATCHVTGGRSWESFMLPISAFRPAAGRALKRRIPHRERVWLLLVGDATEPGTRGETELEIDRIAAVLPSTATLSRRASATE